MLKKQSFVPFILLVILNQICDLKNTFPPQMLQECKIHGEAALFLIM